MRKTSRRPWYPAVLALAGTALASAAPPPSAGVEIERAVPMMGTVLAIRLEAGTRALALTASERAVRALEAAEARLSTWGETSELARLNATPVGEAMALSSELGCELAEAVRCHRLTGGAFDAGVGALVEAWGLRRGGRQPSAAEIAAALASRGLEALALETVDGTASAERRHPGLVLEEGGFGKGAGLDRALEALASAPEVRRAMLDLGGQVAFYGSSPGETGWAVAIADPRERERVVLDLRLDGGSVATSGSSERGIEVGGERRSHVLDPRTGEPAEDFGSLTVVAASGLWADCLATGLYALGPEAALAWAESHEGVDVVVLEKRAHGGLVARATPALEGRLHPRREDLELEIWRQGESPAPPRESRSHLQ